MANESPADFAHLTLGHSGDTVELDRSEQNRAALCAMVQQARLSIDIFSRDLDAALYDTAEFAEALRQMALRTRHARVRILVQNTERLVARGHRLLTLTRRLSSFMAMHVPAREHANYNSAFLVADRVGVLYRPLADRYEATVTFNEPLEAQRLAELFNSMWETSTQPADLRELRI